MTKLPIAKMGCLLFVFCVSAAIAAPAQAVSIGACAYGQMKESVFPPFTSCTLSANPGDVIDVTMASADPNFVAYVGIADFNGNEIAAGCGPELDGILIPDTPLTAVFSSCGGAGADYFWIYIQSTNHPSGAVSLPFGQTQSGTISLPAQSNTYTISTNAKDEVVNFTMTATSGALSPRIRVYNSAGGLLVEAANRSAESGNCTGGSVLQLNSVALPSAGTYTVLVGDCYSDGGGAGGDDSGDLNTGNYNIYMQRTETLTPLLSFDGSDGSNPQWGALVQGVDGNFYGTTTGGGANSGGCSRSPGCGTVFKITPGGALTTLHNFNDDANGWGPMPGLALATNGDFYGVNSNGGNFGVCFGLGCGVAFKISPGGTLNTLLEFNRGAEGGNPNSVLVQATNGNFYGTTVNGGTNGDGAIFEMTPAGALTTLHDFDFTDGWDPQNALMVQGADGDLYGETAGGGSFSCPSPAVGCGTVFRITPGGGFTSLHSFKGSDGSVPFGGLVQGSDGNFYGTTYAGGTNGDGTVFKITPGGRVTTLHSFDGTDGSNPDGGLVQANDGNFYGTTFAGGANGDGTIFEITAGGALTTLHNFNGADGANPNAALLQGTGGTFYGTTYAGGTSGDGTVFSLSTGLGAFVSFVPAARPVGGVVGIFGQGFTDTTAVYFGAAASFHVESDTYLTATVPAGADTGPIIVVEGPAVGAVILTSNKIFRVTPQISSFSPPSGSAGATVVITGDSLAGATEVVFECGKQATFTVDSDTQITATVPAGAMTGSINVVTPGGHVSSPTVFTVTP
jgi:uncharacterized repeat protein (TIGR03803 family)